MRSPISIRVGWNKRIQVILYPVVSADEELRHGIETKVNQEARGFFRAPFYLEEVRPLISNPGSFPTGASLCEAGLGGQCPCARKREGAAPSSSSGG
jgi:hypothetical protein